MRGAFNKHREEVQDQQYVRERCLTIGAESIFAFAHQPYESQIYKFFVVIIKEIISTNQDFLRVSTMILIYCAFSSVIGTSSGNKICTVVPVPCVL